MWYLQQPLQRFGGGALFWDTYIHNACIVKATSAECPLVNNPKPSAAENGSLPANVTRIVDRREKAAASADRAFWDEPTT